LTQEAQFKALPVVAATIVAVMAFYDVVLLGPTTAWLVANPFAPFNGALPAPTQFFADAHWYLVGVVVVTHGAAALSARRRFGIPGCLAAIALTATITPFWAYAVYIPFFTITYAPK
jgi:hypothetical protein